MNENTCSKTTNTWSNSEIFSHPDDDIHVHMYRYLAGFSWRSRASIWTPNHHFWGHPAGETSHFNTKQDICLSIRQPPQLSASTNFISFFIFIFHLQIDLERPPKELDLSLKNKNIPNVFDFFLQLTASQVINYIFTRTSRMSLYCTCHLKDSWM